MAAPKRKAPSDETPAARFKRLAPKRVNNALRAVRLIRNLTGSGYEYTPEEAAKITTALREAVNDMTNAFTEGGKPTEEAFTL